MSGAHAPFVMSAFTVTNYDLTIASLASTLFALFHYFIGANYNAWLHPHTHIQPHC